MPSKYFTDQDLAPYKSKYFQPGEVRGQTSVAKEEAMSPLMSGIYGTMQGATLGFGDELAAGAGALMQKAFTNDPQSFGELYHTYQQQEQGQVDKAQKDHPFVYGYNDLAGSIAPTMAIPGGGSGGILANAARAGATGAAIGGVSAAGHSRAKPTEGEIGQFGKDVGVGAAVGGLAGATLGGASSYVGQKLANSDGAAMKMFDAAYASKSDLAKFSDEDKVRIGRRILDELKASPDGQVFGESSTSIEKQLGPIKEAAGQDVGNARDALDQATGGSALDVSEAAAKIRAQGLPPSRDLYPPGKVDTLDKISGEADKIGKYSQQTSGGRVGFSDFEKNVREPYAKVAFDTDSRTAEAYKDVHRLLKDYVEEQATSRAPEEAVNWMDAKGRYKDLAQADQVFADAALREAQTRNLRPQDATDALRVVLAIKSGSVPVLALGRQLSKLMGGRNLTASAAIRDYISSILNPEEASRLFESAVGRDISEKLGGASVTK